MLILMMFFVFTFKTWDVVVFHTFSTHIFYSFVSPLLVVFKEIFFLMNIFRFVFTMMLFFYH